MVKRELIKYNTGMAKLDNSNLSNYKTISDNYYPVDSAIVMRDKSSN